MLAWPLLALSLAFAGGEPLPVAPEPFQPARATAWILAEQAGLFVFNGYIARPPTWEAPSYALFQQAWTEPTLPDDDDGFLMNAFMHPCMGAHFYMTARNHGFGVAQSAMITFLSSFVWEYVIESWFTRPVVFDLISTPLFGVPLGMALSHAKVPIRRIGPRWLRGLVMIPIDPIEGVDILAFGGPPRPAAW